MDINKIEIKKYIKMFEKGSWHAVVLINKEVVHKFIPTSNLIKLIPYLINRNSEGYNIYFTPSELIKNASRRRKIDFEVKQNVIYLDVDYKSPMSTIKNQYPTPTMIIETSQDRHQVYWVLEEPITKFRQEKLMKDMARHTGSDKAATDVSRAMRLPGFYNKKSNNDFVNIIEYNIGNKTTYYKLRKITPKARRKKMPNITTIQIHHSPTRKTWTDFIKPDSNGSVDYSSVDFSYTLYLLRHGVENNEISNRLRNESYNIEERKGRYVEYYIDLTIKNATEIFYD